MSHRKLVRLRVDGLLGRFDHDIKFDPEWRFLILHGPNGVGKTRLLELVHSAFTGRYLRLARLPFKTARFDFEDGAWVEVSRELDPEQASLPLGEEVGRRGLDIDGPGRLAWKVSIPNEDIVTHVVDPKVSRDDRRLLARIERDFPLERIDHDLWMDLRTREELGLYEVAERFGMALPSGVGLDDLPRPLWEMLEGYKVHLIETQRLLHATRGPQRGRPMGDGPTQEPTVISYAEDLSRRLGGALAANSRTSQELDRSFPSRLFVKEESELATEEEIRQRYAQQLELRGRLASIAILDASPDLQLPERRLADWERKVLSTYLDDAAAKLDTFQELLGRLELMMEIVNERFLFKQFKIDREAGFAFYDEDSGARVSPRHLSSGEQHELVLMYDLLMNVSEHSLVLIDEPEISLHVAWQKAFLDDLDRVASLTTLRFVIATHSPQIIGDWWDQAVELYRVS